MRSIISGNYTGKYKRVGRPRWTKRLFTPPDGNSWSAKDVYTTHDSFMDSLYDLAEQEGWQYNEESPVVQVPVEGTTYDVESLDDIEALEEQESIDNYPATGSTWSPEIEPDELGPIENLTLLYHPHTKRSETLEYLEHNGVWVEIDEMEPTTFDDLIERMEEHYGIAQEAPSRSTWGL